MLNNTIVLLNRLKISCKNKNNYVVVPNVCLNRELLKALYRKGFISSFNLIENRKSFAVSLKMGFSQILFDKLNIISVSSRPVFLTIEDLRKKYRPYDFFIVSTSKGVFIGDEVFFHNLGGELLCDNYNYK